MELLKENDPRLHDPQLLNPESAWDFEIDGDPTDLVRDMMQTLADNGGIGLAAPQVGISKRIFVMGNFMKTIACINPQIVSVSDDREMNLEGSLSFPELWLKVKRPKTCVVSYQTVNGEIVERELTGMESRIFLHEYDHLIGVTFNERVSNTSLQLAKEKRKQYVKKVERINAKSK